MDAVRVAHLREALAGTEWVQSARRFAGSLRTSVAPHRGGLLLVGTESYEPWHLAAHLDDEAAWSGQPELSPTLVRHRVPPAAPAHLSAGLGRIEAAGRRETVLVVTPGDPGPELLERVNDARRAGATVLALDGGADGKPPHEPYGPNQLHEPHELRELHGIAHDVLSADAAEVDLEMVQHLVSAAAGESFHGPVGPSGAPGLPAAGSGRPTFRDRLSRLADHLSAPPPTRW
ncbi:hypothetical protein DB35_17220 [Streptomyces abyssalis]|uniref:SIS domain-containing protein n=1 Tax=Streptomyces abyssalis TaxID=933944 RepID=A0A1E7JKJ3_9ACTN|nr:hypothetical protein [Streptomyces abyssalis]OEU88142.1 hypothetical protein AN215_18390 [Streptomyces abyssalis]OEU91013.1 hypothetical protein DB35_17220 [Streptomyces abyssalis]